MLVKGRKPGGRKTKISVAGSLKKSLLEKNRATAYRYRHQAVLAKGKGRGNFIGGASAYNGREPQGSFTRRVVDGERENCRLS